MRPTLCAPGFCPRFGEPVTVLLDQIQALLRHRYLTSHLRAWLKAFATGTARGASASPSASASILSAGYTCVTSTVSSSNLAPESNASYSRFSSATETHPYYPVR
jgi:hypothetical protein